MRLTEKNGIYTVENLFGKNNLKSKIIHNLKYIKSDIILFESIESYNFEKMNYIADDEQYMAKEFLGGLLVFNNQNRKSLIELEIKNLFKESGDINLYHKFLSNPNCIDKKLMNKINYIIHCQMLLDSTEIIKEHIKENIIFRNMKSVYFDNMYNFEEIEEESCNYIWYENVDVVFDNEHELFYGVITRSKENFDDYYCAFGYYETASDYNLGIYFKNNDECAKKSIERIKNIIDNEGLI